ncbi:uncharacterized protein L969DRAFT_87243 [Mixia osmundae IAM 14324]|uniref:Uncharacterized protein n=1 Tax=Mixia osmundae (strain CBS 9802 / IAM 14324 / JCM 22182 / KY 12970) TaxID=764103 RepID=G7E3A1_MIXOS|nr:uncharacterized protein L969DRAFT_87243 [Mixia osmundae IAM 14324]KEI39298.1 hypothetical protein L969DRAFT_87243 [Mixia osmundae IAM 14324]GAA97311.1 hypothetical protein E5Q_03989 [Mixia osmundae IAM 14324]
MALDSLTRWNELSDTSRADARVVAPILEAYIAQAASTGLDNAQDAAVVSLRSRAITLFLAALDVRSNPWWRDQGDAALRLHILALKLLSRIPTGCEALSHRHSLELLALHCHLLGSSSANTASKSPEHTRMQKSFMPSTIEALRCLANVLLLQPTSRDTLLSIPGMVPALMRVFQEQVDPQIRFPITRILFLVSADSIDVARELVDHLDFCNVFAEAMTSSLLSPIDLTEQLKVVFNVTLWYSRIDPAQVLPDERSVHSRDSFISPEIASPLPSPRMTTETGSTASSSGESAMPSQRMSRGSSAASVRERECDSTSTGSPRLPSFSHSRKTSTASRVSLRAPDPHDSKGKQKDEAEIHVGVPSPLAGKRFARLLECLIWLLQNLSHEAPNVLVAPLSQVINALLNFPLHAHATHAFDDTGNESAYARLLQLLDKFTYAFLSGDLDSATTRTNAERRQIVIDEALPPLLLLLRNFVVEDAEGLAATAIKARLLPGESDRALPLEKRTDVTGRLIRLTNSVYYPKSAETASQLLFSLCRSDPNTYAKEVGYGNAAGFLSSIGQLVPPPSDVAPDFDVITGARRSVDEPAQPEMTEEEKLVESAKLLDLFDRIEQNGVLQVANPMREAQQVGRFEEIGADEARLQQALQEEEDDKDEREALRSMKEYRARKARLAPLEQAC